MTLTDNINLKRSFGLLTLTLYGLGTIIGAGIYVLIGEVAGFAGTLLPFSFLLAGVLAMFTALSYVELSSRFPVCAGEAVYVEEAWQIHHLSSFIGWMIVLTGIVSASAIANGFVGYINVFIDLERYWAITGLILLLFCIAAVGMKTSALAIALVTMIEVGGLLYVIIVAANAEVTESITSLTPASNISINGMLLGSFLAFYAFIGFEDMVNVIEEVKNPRRNFPLAIILAVVIAVIFYSVIAIVAIRVISPAELAQSDAPLATIISVAGGNPSIIGLISLLAVINGGLVQMIMSSRVLYGMANRNMAPAFFARINARSRTPIIATTAVGMCVLGFSLMLPLAKLAQLTSLMMLVVFTIVNVALISIKTKASYIKSDINIPIWIPFAGALSSSAFILYQISEFLI
jgi:basic amino acid/polyamine antiporter, APA family